MTTKGIALVGAGAIGRAHLATLSRMEGCRAVAVADPSPAAEAVAKAHGVPWFADHRDMLDRIRPDGVINATPNVLHRPVALDVIARGIPQIVEKPIATTAEEADAIAEAAEAAGVAVLVGHHRRHNPIVREAARIVAAGELGRLASVSVLAQFFKPDDYFDLAWRREPGGGPVLINLIHEIDLVRFVCGEIVEVQAVTSNARRGFSVEDTAAVILRLEGGALVTISLCDTAVAPWSWDLASGESPNYPPQPARVVTHHLCGTEAALALPTLDRWSYCGKKSWFEPIDRRVGTVVRADPYVEQIRHLCAVIDGLETPVISARDGAATLRATLAVLRAAETGRPVMPRI